MTWTKQNPASSPPALANAPMAYDAATGTAVLFGSTGHQPRQTWTWDGSTWTRQSPATSPLPQADASMAYDAATGTVVLFGGANVHGFLHGTWTWDGSTWTRQSPATSPPARADASMAYDAATGTVVLFGGYVYNGQFHTLGDTWTWDGSTWTRQSPGASPPTRWGAAMAYDAATSTVVLFGGDHQIPLGLGLADTWAWDGSAWTEQSPATSPSARSAASLAYDAATGTVVLFGGTGGIPGHPTFLRGTWTWSAG